MTSTSGGEAIVSGLVAHGVDTVFGLPGAQIYGLFDAFQQAQLKVDRRASRAGLRLHGLWLCALQPAGPACSAWCPARACSTPVRPCSPPSDANEPVLCLTGQVPTQFLGKGRGHLHEMPDQLATLRSFVKWADRIEYPDAAPTLVSRARFRRCCRAAAARWRWKCPGTCSPQRARDRRGKAVRSVPGAAARPRSHQGRRRADRQPARRR